MYLNSGTKMLYWHLIKTCEQKTSLQPYRTETWMPFGEKPMTHSADQFTQHVGDESFLNVCKSHQMSSLVMELVGTNLHAEVDLFICTKAWGSRKKILWVLELELDLKDWKECFNAEQEGVESNIKHPAYCKMTKH